MPKLKTQIEQEKRERALMDAMDRCRRDKDVLNDYQMAQLLGTCKSNFSRIQRERYQTMRLGAFGDMVRRLGMTDKEVCAALGVTYNGNT